MLVVHAIPGAKWLTQIAYTCTCVLDLDRNQRCGCGNISRKNTIKYCGPLCVPSSQPIIADDYSFPE